MLPNFDPKNAIKKSRYWGVPRKCKHCDNPAKKNLRPDGKNKGYYKTCGSARCLSAQYRDKAVCARKAWRTTFVCECCGSTYVAKCRRQRWCHVCVPNAAARGRMQRYGLSDPQYKKMLEEQNNLCYLCREKPAKYVDHGHVRGQVRKLLCEGCNTKLAGIDDQGWLESALNYIKEFGV